MSFPGTKSAIPPFLPFAAQKARWCGSSLSFFSPKLPTPKSCMLSTGLFLPIYLLNVYYRSETAK